MAKRAATNCGWDGWEGRLCGGEIPRPVAPWHHGGPGWDWEGPCGHPSSTFQVWAPQAACPILHSSARQRLGRQGIATQGEVTRGEDRVRRGPGRHLETRDGGSGRENLGRGQRLDRVTVRRTGPTIYWAMPFLSQIIYHQQSQPGHNDNDLLLSNDDDDQWMGKSVGRMFRILGLFRSCLRTHANILRCKVRWQYVDAPCKYVDQLQCAKIIMLEIVCRITIYIRCLSMSQCLRYI